MESSTTIAEPTTRKRAWGVPKTERWTLLSAALVLPTLIVLGDANGGYFPSSWGWSALVFSWAAIVLIVVKDTIALSKSEMAYLAALVLFLCWTALSVLWSPTTTGAVLEIERTLCYVTFAIALCLIARRPQISVVLGSVLVAITAIASFGLATRLYPGRLRVYDSFVAYRLSEPLGYWNALAVLCALGCVLATGFAARATNAVVRGLAASSLVVFVPTMYFTFGRGGWLALLVGLMVAVSVDPRRLQYLLTLVVLVPWPMLAVWRSHQAKGLTTDYSPVGVATNDGAALARTLAVLALGAFIAVVALTLVTRRVAAGKTVRRIFAVAVAGLLLVVVGAALATYGGPAKMVHKAIASMRTSSPNVEGDQTNRLFSLSSNGRFSLWSSAVDAARAHPVVGVGGGSYEQVWYRTRDNGGGIARNAHSVFLEVAAELGIVGLLLLVAILLIPISAALRSRQHPLIPVALGAFVAFFAHAALDWDWQMPVVTIAALACGWALLVANPQAATTRSLGAITRGAAITVLGMVTVFAFVAMVGNRALGQAQAAANRDDPDAVVRHARTAERWAPWSSTPLALKADVALERGALPEAQSLYRAAIAKDPDNWQLWLSLALASRGHSRQAALREVQRLNPLSPELTQLRTAGL